MIPNSAILEADLGNRVAIYDVSHLLMTNPTKPQRKRRKEIVRLYIHKSGGVGRSGFEGLARSTQFVVQRRDFPGCAYTFWLSRSPDVDGEGRRVIYRGQPDEIRSYHTGGIANDHGVAAALQGNPSKHRLTQDQSDMLERLLFFAHGAYDLDAEHPISTHSRAKRFGAPKNKRVCPGRYAEQWLTAWQSQPISEPLAA